ncbi:MAG: PH domain-containing protein, partial [Nocardioides sp.]
LASYEIASWLAPFVLLALLCGALLAVDRTRALGHCLVDGFVVARSGSLNRRREALAAASVIGWNLRATWFQRRLGLTDLVATTAGGHQRVQVLDLSEDAAVTLARTAQPGLLEQFLG